MVLLNCIFVTFGTVFVGLYIISSATAQSTVDMANSAQSTSDKAKRALDGNSFFNNSTYYHALASNIGMPLLTDQAIQSIHADKLNLTVIIHIGPMKTGSSAIQESFYSVLQIPAEENGFEDATQVVGGNGIGVWNLIGCFRDPDAPSDGFIVCKPETLSQVQNVAARRKNLIISAEYLTSPDTNIAALKDFLRPWKDQKVVAYYRHYYDWLVSFHNQGNKNVAPKDRHSLADFLRKEKQDQYWWNTMYIIEALRRWGEHILNLQVFNMYEISDGDVREPFFCEALPQTSNACNKFRKKKAMAANKQSVSPTNPSISFVYDDLAYYSSEMGLWSESKSGLSFRQVALKAKEHQENELNLTSYDFGNALECPDKETANFLIQRSLEAEKHLFPEYFKEKGEQEMLADFSKQVRTKLCYVNAKVVLGESLAWRIFFKNLNTQ